MSRIGKQPISVPDGVQIQVQSGGVLVKGSKGELTVRVHPLTQVLQEDGMLRVTVEDIEDRESSAVWGLTRALLANAVEGVGNGFEKRLVVVGVGYRAEMKGRNLDLQVGFSHPVILEPLEGVEMSVEAAPAAIEMAQASIVVRGADKERVGRMAADIRKVRPPEPYKGKGIRYDNEYVRRKAGKGAAT